MCYRDSSYLSHFKSISCILYQWLQERNKIDGEMLQLLCLCPFITLLIAHMFHKKSSLDRVDQPNCQRNMVIVPCELFELFSYFISTTVDNLINWHRADRKIAYMVAILNYNHFGWVFRYKFATGKESKLLQYLWSHLVLGRLF